MKKWFNDIGVCVPEQHYMVDISTKTRRIVNMIERGDYFVISRPRQYGKTTTIYMLNKFLKTTDDYFPIKISFEGIGQEGFVNAAVFIEEFFSLLKGAFVTSGNENLVKFIDSEPIPDRFSKLDLWISELVRKTEKKIVLMIDEVDKSSNNQLFLDFLGMLRNKYLKRIEERALTFHSVILAGLYDIKSLKLKLRPEAETKYNSPWNIAVDFNVDMSFSAPEITTMLEEYVKETGVEMNTDAVAKELHYYTSGYPFLVSKVCKIIDEEIIPDENRKKWLHDDIERAIVRLLNTPNTNFDNVIKNLENEKELYDLVEKIVLDGVNIEYNFYSPVISMGVMHGIFKQGGPSVAIHNRIYRELIYNYMTTNFRLKVLLQTNASKYNFQDYFITKDGSLDFKTVLLKFQEFMKKEFSKKDQEFMERNGRLVFLAFIKPIINGQGYDFKEVQVSEEKRLDVIVTFQRQKFVVELKVWRGKEAHMRGIKQLADYLDVLSLKQGYLVIFDFTRKGKKEFKHETISVNEKEIVAVWV
ncbi:MAG: AAA family ATPase [Candidatus Omnitrophota bacterium]